MKKSKIILAILIVSIITLAIIPNSFATDNTTITNLNNQTTTQINTYHINEVSNTTSTITNSESNNYSTTNTQNNLTAYGDTVSYASGTFTNLSGEISYQPDIIYLTGDITENSQLGESITYYNGISISHDLTIDGQGYTINGLNKIRTFYLNSGYTLTLKNLILTGGKSTNYAGNIYLNRGAKLILDNVLIMDNSANWAGSIYGKSQNTITITNSIFQNNHAKYAGSIYLNNGTLNMENTNFTNTYSTSWAGAIGIENSIATIKDSVFTNDYSTGDIGGAIYSRDTSLTLTNTNFTNCKSNIGGAIAQLNNTLTLNYCNFQNNTANYWGGAIYNIYSKLNIYQTKFQYNNAFSGGALYISSSENLNIQSSNFTRNNASYGGVIYSYNNKIFTNTNNLYTYNTALNSPITYSQGSPILRYSNNNTIVIINNNTYTTNIPSSYDLRDYGLVTSVKNQGDSGSCWAFSALAALESCILKANGVTYDFSEENFKNLMALYSEYEYKNSLPNQGGWNEMDYGYLAGWLGPVNETTEPYDEYSTVSSLFSNLVNVQNILTLTRTSYTDNEGIKLAVLNYGAVSTGIYYNSLYLNSNKNYYYSGNNQPNHAVCIIGWDDTYSRYNFRNTPSGDGAWIIKNSWGTNWGTDGYAYVSYYDTKLAQLNVADSFTFILNDSTKYNKNYQYDYVGMTDWLVTNSNSAWYSVAYTSVGEDYLKAFGTYFKTSTDYTAYIYVNNTLKYTQNGYSPSGYFTIKLGENIPINNGDIFKIILNIRTNDSAYIPIQENISVNSIIYPGISYYSLNGQTWTDLATYSGYSSYHTYYPGQVACLKAYTIPQKEYALNIPNIEGLPGSSQTINVNVTDSYGLPVSQGTITFLIDGVNYTGTVNNGVASVNINLPKNNGYTNVTVTYSNGEDMEKITTTIFVSNATILESNNFTEVYGQGLNYTGKLYDAFGNPLKGRHISLNLHRVNSWYYTYWATTDLNGEFQLPIHLAVGSYIIKPYFPGDKTYQDSNTNINSIIVTKSVNATFLSVNNFLEYYGAGKNFTGKLLDYSNNPLVGQHIAINLTRIGSWTRIYWVTTDLNGEFQLPINLSVGRYTAQCSYGGTSKYDASSAYVNITVMAL